MTGDSHAGGGRRGNGQRSHPSGRRLTSWQVSVTIPASVSSTQLEAAVAHLSYLEARQEALDGRPVITMVVRAVTFDKARRYAVERVLSLLRDLTD